MSETVSEAVSTETVEAAKAEVKATSHPLNSQRVRTPINSAGSFLEHSVRASLGDETSKLYVTKQSPNLLVEFQRYKWRKDSAGNMLNQPVDVFNHGMDSIRYVALNMLKIKPQNTFNISILSNDGASYRQAGNSAGSGRVSIR